MATKIVYLSVRTYQFYFIIVQATLCIIQTLHHTRSYEMTG